MSAFANNNHIQGNIFMPKSPSSIPKFSYKSSKPSLSTENSTTDTDSDPESDTTDLDNSYHPISFESDTDESEPDNIGDEIRNPNPNLNCNGRIEENEEVEREREREATILRAFREDESRRNAPLTPENASRVMDAMRGVRFSGSAPDWVDRVGEDRWVDRLRRLRGENVAGASQN